MAFGPSSTGVERAAALSRMVAALEAAKKARDSGHNVQQVRGMLKAARSAFEAGDYTTAARFANQVLDTCADQSARAAGGPPRAVVLERMSDALRATKKRKRRGFNVEQSQELLRQARAAFESGDYQMAMDLADQALQLCSPDSRSASAPR